jgi:outer membrane protein TolC
MRRTRSALVLAFLLTFALPLAPLFPAFGDEAAEPAAEVPVVGQLDLPESSTPQEELPLSLRDAVAMGIENNLNIQVDRFAPLIADEDSAIAWSAYDPMGSGSVGYFSQYEPAKPVFPTYEFERTVLRQGFGQLAIEGLVPYLGASLGLTLDIDEGRTSNAVFTGGYSPTYNSRLGVNASVPLLKNLIWNQPWTLVKSSEIVYEASLEVFRTNLMDVVQNIANAYWNLIATAEQARVARKSLETAESLLDQVQTQYEVGVVSKVQVVEAEAGVAEREVDVIRQDNFYQRAQDILIDAILGPHLTASSRLQIQPTDDPTDYVEYEIDVQKASENAFSNRPELQAALKEIERQEIQLKFARNQWLPEFNVEGGYSVSGQRGKGGEFTISGVPVVVPDSGDGIGDSFSDWGTDRGGKEFNVRGIFRVPLGNVRGRHGLSRAKLELRRAKTRELQLRQSIILEVRNGARNLTSAQQGIVAAERRRLAAAEQLRAERIRLEYGEATPFDVLLRDRDLVDAESQQIGALQLYQTSQVDLQRAQGTILQTHNIVVEEAGTLR